jgi:glycolate oxidase iron-sulfur subunit
MRTNFSEARLAEPDIQEANRILRTCVHCGFCLATCPTYLLLGDELDSPRGRIYLAKEMLEQNKPATPPVVKHLDRCLTCLSCMTTCPSGVDYGHLVARARVHIEKTYRRPLPERLLRWCVATIVPRPGLFRLASIAGLFGRPFARLMPGPVKSMIAAAPRRIGTPSWVDRPQVIPAEGPRRRRVTLLNGCAQQVLRPEINEATARVLTRHGCEVIVAKGVGCCGGIMHQLGWEERTRAMAKANIAAWSPLLEDLDAIVFNASGCGVSLKDYGHLLSHDAEWAERARRVAALSMDVSEVLMDVGAMPASTPTGQTVTYHSACTMQHGLGLRTQAKLLLTAAGFTVREPAEPHICCGSAGAYSILQPDLSQRLRARKVANLEATAPEIVASGNIGCITHVAAATRLPVVHTVELIDWATGGPKPAQLAAAGNSGALG